VTLEPGTLAWVLGVVALGPWGLVLVVALVRGYNLTLRLRRKPPPARNVAGMSDTNPAVVPAVVPVVVEPDPPARVDPDKLGEAVERADVTERDEPGTLDDETHRTYADEDDDKRAR